MRKRQIIVTAFLIISILGILVFDVRHHNLIISFLLLLLFIFYAREHFKLVKRSVGGELFLRRQQKSFKWWTLLLAVVTTLVNIGGEIIPKWMLVLFWLIVMYEGFIVLLVRRLNPITLVLDGYQLKFRGIIVFHRNISGLTQIDQIDATGKLKFTFRDESAVQIKKSDYLDSDIFQLIEICKERAKEGLILSENLVSND